MPPATLPPPPTAPVAWVLCQDDQARSALADGLRPTSGDVRMVDSGDALRKMLADGNGPTIFVIDDSFEDWAKDGFLDSLRQAAPEAAVLLIADDAAPGHGGDASLPTDIWRLPRPVAPGVLRLAADRSLESGHHRRQMRHLEEELWESVRGTYLGGVATLSDGMRGALRLADGALRDRHPLLLMGESGTGKRSVARALHAATRVGQGAFVEITTSGPALLPLGMAGIGETVIPVEGRATLAALLERAAGGTLFIDDLGDLDLPAQDELLAAMKTTAATASDAATQPGPRLMAATRHDLVAGMEAGRFREELFYRMAVRPILLPPLRTRTEDIPALFDHFVRRVHGHSIPLEDDARGLLLAHPWPGNMHELQMVASAVVVVATGGRIDGATIRRCLADRLQQVAALSDAPAFAAPTRRAPRKLDDLCREEILFALNHHGWNVAEAARSLGMGRATLYKYVSRHRLMELRRAV